MRSLSAIGRVAAVGAVIAAIVLVGLILFGGTGAGGYTVKARFLNAGQLVKGNPVQVGGVPVGSVKGIKITPDGHAEIKMSIDGDHSPLRRGTRAEIRQFSQSGLANRYVDLKLPPDTDDTIPEGGVIETDKTVTQVDLDELYNTLDPETRRSLQGFFKGSADQWRNMADEANVGFQYLNPALSTSRRLFNELTRDTPLLQRFLVDSSEMVTALASRRDDLAALVGNLNETTRALGSQKEALAESIGRLPPFMRRANTTFVNLRSTLDQVDPLVEASKPVAKRLQPFLSQARAFAADAEPTVRDLSLTIRRPGKSNDLINLLQTFPPLASIATETKNRSYAPGGKSYSVGETRGAFQESVEALQGGAGEISFARPYTADFLGWFDDFSTTGGGFDALGATARGFITMSPFLHKDSLAMKQYRRCPGSAEAPLPDGSNVLSAEERDRLDCEESHRGTPK
ncbi:MAG: phospholipid/cholesterol/gamma-HCH transport system substrate-binding protein [Thermoleophilaceae bacterium]|nr:phospholipid/cholesterol/gamma-HCH transport system substrate-binding protein [Thermoleophilaceae bacterium]